MWRVVGVKVDGKRGWIWRCRPALDFRDIGSAEDVGVVPVPRSGANVTALSYDWEPREQQRLRGALPPGHQYVGGRLGAAFAQIAHDRSVRGQQPAPKWRDFFGAWW